MAIFAPKIKLNDGYEIPAFGFGTFEHPKGEEAILAAIDAGYRHIDTAYMYANEKEVGNAIRAKIAEGVIKREDVFITSKLWCNFHEPERVEYACRLSLKRLNLDYIDLYLMHFPMGFTYYGDDVLLPRNPDQTRETNDVDYVDTYKAMEKLIELGLVRSIGVANFNSEQIDRLIKNCNIKPVTNQVECNISLAQRKLTKFCKDRDIHITAYTPLGRPNIETKTPEYLFAADVEKIAKKYNKTNAQVALRYLHELGVIPIPRSYNPERIQQNINIFDFQLDDSDKKILEKFDTGFRIVTWSDAVSAKYYPFNLEY